MRVDLYREVHKGLRSALSKQLFDLGRLDPGDKSAVAGYVAGFNALCELLEMHAAHEETSVHPLLLAQYGELVADLEADHAKVDAKLEAARRLVIALADRSESDGAAAIVEATHALSDFVGHYALHMLREERESMPALWGLYDDERLFAVQGQIRGSIPPPVMGRFMQYMLPAMNLEERSAAFGGMRASAPPEAFAAMCDLAANVLTADEWGAVKARVGF